MGEIKDKNGNVITIGDIIRIGDNRYSTVAKIQKFITMNGGADLMARTDIGDFNVTLIEKCR